MFALDVLTRIGFDTGPELFSGEAALAGVILGVAVFLCFLLGIGLTHVGTRRRVVIPYLPRVIGEHGLPLLLVVILTVLLGAIYLLLLLWPLPVAG